MHRARPRELIAFETIVSNRWKRVKVFAGGHHTRGVIAEELARIVAIHMIDDVRQTPFKRPDQAIVIFLVIPALTPVHVILPDRHSARYYGKS